MSKNSNLVGGKIVAKISNRHIVYLANIFLFLEFFKKNLKLSYFLIKNSPNFDNLFL